MNGIYTPRSRWGLLIDKSNQGVTVGAVEGDSLFEGMQRVGGGGVPSLVAPSANFILWLAS